MIYVHLKIKLYINYNIISEGTFALRKERNQGLESAATSLKKRKN